MAGDDQSACLQISGSSGDNLMRSVRPPPCRDRVAVPGPIRDNERSPTSRSQRGPRQPREAGLSSGSGSSRNGSRGANPIQIWPPITTAQSCPKVTAGSADPPAVSPSAGGEAASSSHSAPMQDRKYVHAPDLLTRSGSARTTAEASPSAPPGGLGGSPSGHERATNSGPQGAAGANNGCHTPAVTCAVRHWCCTRPP